MAAKAWRIEWLPLTSYYQASPQSALFDLGQKGLLVSPLRFLIAARQTVAPWRRRWGSAAWGLGIGAILEATQLLQLSRVPSTTDVLVFGASAWAGATLCARYHAIIEET